MHVADVKSVLRVFSVEVPAREKDDLKEEPIVLKLRKVRPSLALWSSTMLTPGNRLAVRATTVSNNLP